MKIKFGQHIYGRKKEKGFSTIGYSPDVTTEDLKSIEKNCIYELPTSIYYDKGIEKPIKYVFYKIDEEKVILGRGMYTGLDELGRVGNYIFHNLIFQVNDIISFEINPISLIRYLDRMRVFTTETPFTERLECLESDLVKDDEVFSPASNLLSKNIAGLQDIIYLCLDLKEIDDSIIIEYDRENEILDFLYDIYFITPKRLWKELSFNTLWYKEHKFLFRGISKGFPFPPKHSIKIGLERGIYESNISIRDTEKYEYVKLAVKKALSDKQGLSTLYLLQELAETANWVGFMELYKDLQQDIQKVIYDYNKNSLLTELLRGNIQLFGVLKEFISNDDRSKVFKSKEFTGNLIRHRDEKTGKDFVNWFYEQAMPEDKKDVYLVFLSNLWLIDLLLEKAKEEKMKINKNVAIIREMIEKFVKQYTEQGGYDKTIEERLLNALCEMIESNNNIDMSDILKSVKKLPLPKTPKLRMIRALIRYKLGDNSELISLIKEEKYQSIIYELLNEGIKTLDWEKYKRSFQEKETKSSMFRWIK